MNMMKRALALVLALTMLLGMAACGKPAQTAAPEQPDQTLNRQDKELVAELIGGEDDASRLTDEELDALVDSLLKDEEVSDSGVVNLSTGSKPKNPSVDVTENSGAYDENGAIKEPFDQVYPELIEKEEVAFSGESILIKLASGTLTDGLKAAGVGALEQIVPMEKAAWYEAKLLEGTDAKEALAAVRELDEVLLAEFNYEIQVAALDDYKHFDKEQDEDFKKNGHNKDQWHFHHCGIPDGYEEMETEGGDPSVIVAVIDSGVDYTHEDLKDNMWVNTKEIPDNNRDDDGNGYVDDYYGVDIVAGKGSGDDTNGHGTHVAGIIAARNNNVGTLGIAYNVKIMSVKAAMHNGTLNQADIAKAVLYAYNMGAEVINMSFGGTASSIAVQDALQTAYTRCVLVASAGNDGENNEPTPTDDEPLPNYPAALSYVLGVMSVDETGRESVFSNWDVKAFNGVEYELYAPGENIMSTLPGNKYGYLSGTSMAAPVVSSFAAILRSEFSDRDMYPTKFIYGQLASTSGIQADCLSPGAHGGHNMPQIVDLNAALTKLPKPEVNVQDFAVFDDPKYSAANNGDGVIDAGETVAVGITLRNRWGMSENTLVTLDTLSGAGLSDPYINIKNPTVDFGGVGTYSTKDSGKIYTDELLTGWENPFLVEISKDCPNDYRFTLNVTITCENALDPEDTATYTTEGKVNATVRSGVVLPSLIEEDMVLTPDSLYIIPNATVIQQGVTVRVEPGTHIQFWSDDPKDPYASDYIAFLLVNGNFLVEGTKENPVYIYPSQLMDRYGVEIGASSTGYVSMEYADITNFFYNLYHGDHTGTQCKIQNADHCTFRMNYSSSFKYRMLSSGKVSSVTMSNSENIVLGTPTAKNCVFYKINRGATALYGSADSCVFVDCKMTYPWTRNCVFYGGSSLEQVSKVTVPTVQEVYYREETGTTYVTTNGTINQLLMQETDMQRLILETQEEKTWLLNKLNYSAYYRLELQYNGTQLVWSDGSELGEFLDPSGLAKTTYNPDQLYIYSKALKNYTSVSSPRYIYEIPGHILPTQITFHEYEVSTDTAATYQITPRNLPVQLPLEAFVYESSDESVLRVSETGLVTPMGKGSADVYVYSQDRAVYNYVTFHIVDYVPLESVTFPMENLKLAWGASAAMGCILSPADTTRRNVTYTSSDTTVATVDTIGNVTGVGFGNAVITAKIEGFEVQLPVEVAMDALSFANSYMEVAVGEKVFAACVTDPVGTDPSVMQYTSSDETIATVDAQGNITGVASGTVTITASCGVMTAEATLKVYKKATDLSIHNKTAITIGLDAEPVAVPQDAVEYSYLAEPTLQWSVADQSVAKLEEGMIVPVGVGTTVLTVTDTRSGLSDAIALYVTERTLAKAKEIYPSDHAEYESFFYVLLEDGSLYEVKVDYVHQITKTLLYENVKDFDCGGTAHIVLFEDDTVKVVDPEAENNGYSNTVGDFDFFKGKSPSAVACYTGQYYVITEDWYSGNAYAWGFRNDNYQLGTWDGGYTNWPVYEPKRMQALDGICITDIIAVDGMTVVLDGSTLYMIGGEWLQEQGAKRISANAAGVSRVYTCEEYGSEITSKSRKIAYIEWSNDTGSNHYCSFGTADSAPVKENTGYNWSAWSVGDGIVLTEDYIGYDSDRGEVIWGVGASWKENNNWGSSQWSIENVAAAQIGSEYVWMIGEDGTVYQLDKTYNYHRAQVQPDIVTTFPLGNNGESDSKYRLVSTNISADGVLRDNKLVLTFDAPLYLAESYPAYDWDFYRKTPTATGWSDARTAAQVSLQGNVLVISYSFTGGYDYNFELDWDIRGANGTGAEEDIDIVFTYEKPSSVGAGQGATPENPTENIHQSVLDTTVVRIPSVNSVKTKLNSIQAEKQINPAFYGNAVLNPVSTDTNVERWLRILAPAVTAGTYQEIPLGGNWWGTTNEKTIGLQMVDYTDFITYARLMYAPYLTEAPENTFPFVTSVKLFNKYGEEVTTVGNEEITFRVTFNRDMDTSIPLQVRFGSAMPYGDYEIAGQYVNERTWEGTYTLNTLIENGNQYFTIANGCSATEDLELQPDQGRFGFVIDTTAAQALIMQGTAGDTGIRLSWTQDDFKTLMGYNVYRSTKEDGQYTRLNKTVIPANTMEWFDDTVEPGKIYYYNFTVVQTDLSESEPSGKIVIMSKDTMAPNIYHSPVANAFTGANLVLDATVTDNLSIAYANLYYRIAGTQEWSIIRMNKLNDSYSAIIPAQYITVAGVEYYIEAFDGVSYTYKGTADAPYTVAVQEAIDANSLGDVDGDGVITNLDALLLLYAINDKYNMTAEEFARADLNGDGELWAAEALRILQYVSGTVGSVKM